MPCARRTRKAWSTRSGSTLEGLVALNAQRAEEEEGRTHPLAPSRLPESGRQPGSHPDDDCRDGGRRGHRRGLRCARERPSLAQEDVRADHLCPRQIQRQRGPLDSPPGGGSVHRGQAGRRDPRPRKPRLPRFFAHVRRRRRPSLEGRAAHSGVREIPRMGQRRLFRLEYVPPWGSVGLWGWLHEAGAGMFRGARESAFEPDRRQR